MANELEKISFGTMLGIKDNEYLTIKKNLKKLEDEFKEKQRKLKNENNPYLADLINQNNNVLHDKIEASKKKCDGLVKIISHLTDIASTNIAVDTYDEKIILDEYESLKNELSELTELIIRK